MIIIILFFVRLTIIFRVVSNIKVLFENTNFTLYYIIVRIIKIM